MKTKLLIICLLASINCLAQKIKVDSIPIFDGNYEYKEIVKVDTLLTKDDLYRNSKLFFANAFKSSKDVIQYDDRGEGKVIGKGIFQCVADKKMFLTSMFIYWTVNFSVELSCKNGRYRYRIYNVLIDERIENIMNPSAASQSPLTIDGAYTMTKKGMFKDQAVKLINQLNTQAQSLILSIKSYMSMKKDLVSKEDF